MINKDQIETLFTQKGFHDFKWIDPEEIIVAQWVRVKCMFGCSDYGLGTCPPNTPSVEDCEKFFKEYSTAVILKISTLADKNHYPSDWSAKMTTLLLDVEREIFLLGHPKTFLLNQTCCALCKECPGNRHDCKDKKNARPSPESFAVDVYKTVHNAGMELEVVSENPSKINRIAILLIE